MKLIYIAGCDRSGSTILESHLGVGNVKFSLGEGFHFLERGLIDIEKCSCGKNFDKCIFWSDFYRKAYEKYNYNDLEKMNSARIKMARPRAVLLDTIGKTKTQDILEYQKYISLYLSLIDYAEARTGAEVLIDSSKNPCYIYWVKKFKPNFKFSVIHLVRDPRGVTFSFKKKRERVEASNISRHKFMNQHSTLTSVKIWIVSNLTCLLMKKYYYTYQVVFYENIKNYIEKLHSQRKESGKKSAEIESHVISGNPSRFNNLEDSINIDTGWKSASKLQNFIVYTLCCPLWKLLRKQEK